MISKAIFSLLFLPLAFSQVPISEFFPFGPSNGDLTVPAGDDTFVNVALSPGHTFNFFNTAYDNVWVNINGAISFLRGINQYTPTCEPMGEPMIIPFWADVDTRYGGDVFYRETTDSAVLNRIADEVQRIYPGSRRVNMQWAFITTWSEVPFFGAAAADPSTGCKGLDLRNTFQTVLTTDGTKSYSMFYYNKVEWTAGTASGSDCNGQGGTPAKAEFDAGDGVAHTIPGSCTSDVIRITDTTNVDEPGRWVFQVDRDFQTPPPVDEIPTSAPEQIQEDPTTTEVPTDAPTDAPTEIPTEIPTDAPTDAPTEIPTELPTELPTEIPTEVPTRPTSAAPPTTDECDPFNCARYGFCYDYTFCNRETRQWENLTCSDGLYWNPDANGGGLSEGQGSCDVWDNLPQQTKDSYRSDGQCFPLCHYQEVSKCSSNYLFHEKHRDARMQRTLNCPIDSREGRYIPLVWVQERETCDFCYNAVDENGSQCCPKYDNPASTGDDMISVPVIG